MEGVSSRLRFNGENTVGMEGQGMDPLLAWGIAASIGSMPMRLRALAKRVRLAGGISSGLDRADVASWGKTWLNWNVNSKADKPVYVYGNFPLFLNRVKREIIKRPEIQSGLYQKKTTKTHQNHHNTPIHPFPFKTNFLNSSTRTNTPPTFANRY